MSLLSRITGGSDEPERMNIDEYAALYNSFAFDGIGYGYSPSGVQQTLAGGQVTEMAPNNFVGLATQAYAANGVVFACMLVRQLAFSSVRFTYQNLRKGKPSDTFGGPELRLLERPWVGGTTQDMLSRLLQDADLAGNSYWMRDGDELVRMRPDWVDIVVEPRMINGGSLDKDGNIVDGQIGWRKVGYLYTECGLQSGNNPVGLLANEVVHFCPIPDPLANFRGMSWLTPILREVQADQAMTAHQRAFFDNGATVNMIIKHAVGAEQDAVKKWQEAMESRHSGARNAYKNLNLYPGADATVVGSNLKDIDFKNVRGGGETRVAAAAGVPPVIVGLSEGLAAATYSNYGQARRRFADGTMHPLWQNAAGSMERVVPPPDSASRLWYDPSDVPFLREDEKDAADIQAVRAQTIASLIAAGYEADSVIAAIEANDFTLLSHTGLVSVQLLPPAQRRRAHPTQEVAVTTVDRLQRPPTAGVREAPFVLRAAAADDTEQDDGLTLDGFGAVFGTRTIIDSYEGRFAEQFALGSMKRSFRETPPKVQFDHGRHPMIGSIPIAALRSITEEVDPVLAPHGGAHIVARVFDNWLMAPVRDAISAEAISGMSMRFSVVREQWTTHDGKTIRDEAELMQLLRQAIYDDVPDDELPMRTVREAKVPEMGPVVWPAYQDTSVSMRSTVIDLGRLHEPEQRDLLARAVFLADAAAQEDAQRDTDPVVEHPSTEDDEPPAPSATDAQRSTPAVGERPSKELNRNQLRLRNQRDTLINLKQKGTSR